MAEEKQIFPLLELRYLLLLQTFRLSPGLGPLASLILRTLGTLTELHHQLSWVVSVQRADCRSSLIVWANFYIQSLSPHTHLYPLGSNSLQNPNTQVRANSSFWEVPFWLTGHFLSLNLPAILTKLRNSSPIFLSWMRTQNPQHLRREWDIAKLLTSRSIETIISCQLQPTCLDQNPLRFHLVCRNTVCWRHRDLIREPHLKHLK